jgi:cyclic pyranopterin phosphate synthase
MPVGFTDYEEPKDWLTFDEIERVVKAFAALGVGNIRLTGGEPLLRKDLPLLVSRLSQVQGINDISLSTNATQLERHALALKSAGLNRLNVSMDSLNPQRFSEICGRDALPQVLNGLQAAKDAGLSPIKINAVFMHDTPSHEVDDLVDYCIKNQFVLRLIEVMLLNCINN